MLLRTRRELQRPWLDATRFQALALSDRKQLTHNTVRQEMFMAQQPAAKAVRLSVSVLLHTVCCNLAAPLLFCPDLHQPT